MLLIFYSCLFHSSTRCTRQDQLWSQSSIQVLTHWRQWKRLWRYTGRYLNHSKNNSLTRVKSGYSKQILFVTVDLHQRSFNAIVYLPFQVAELGAQSTSAMSARAGRSSYVSEKHLNKPDPGALAVTVWFRAAFNALKN